MRIDTEKIAYMKSRIAKITPVYRLFLFGSRADDQARGGDIDFLILSEPPLTQGALRQLKIDFQLRFGEQKLDLLSFCPDSRDPFKELAMMEGIEL